jgi:hypothetical protein
MPGAVWVAPPARLRRCLPATVAAPRIKTQASASVAHRLFGHSTKSLSENRLGEGDSPILLRGLRKIGTVPTGSRIGSKFPIGFGFISPSQLSSSS